MSNKYTDILPNTSMLLANSLNQETHLFLNQVNKNSSMLLRFPRKIATQISQSQTLKNISIKHINNNLRIGDIVLMRYSFKSKDSTSTECILYPEKIVSNQMYCIPFNKIEEIGGDKSIFKRSLFRIENPQHSFFQYQYKQMKNIIKTSNLDNKNKKQNTVIQDEEKKLKHLQTLADEERKGNSSEFLLNYNNDVAYGQIIQFRNVFTGELLVVDMANISKEIGCLDVILNPLGGQTAWFKLIPSHRIRNEGECVSYCDDFYIQATCIESDAFMHVIHHDDDNNNNNNHRIRGMEITISCRKSIFMLSLFESAEEIKRDKSKGILKSTSVIKLYNTDYEGYLHASVKNGQIYMQKPKTEKRLHNPRYMVQYNSTNNPNHILQTNNATSNIGNTNSNAAHYRYISSITVPFQNMNQKEEDTGNISVVGDDLLQNSNSNEGIIDRDTNKNMNNLSNHSIEGEDNLADDLEYGNVEEEMDNPIALAVKRASTYVVTLDQNVKELNCNTYWEVQYEKIFEGKNISFGIPIRLRHVPSGFYLSFNSDSSEITLSQAADDQTLFFICPDKQQQIHMNDNIIMNKNQVYFLAKDSEAFLKVHEVNMDNSQTQYGLVLSKNDKIDYAKMVFKIEIQNDILVKVNYNVALTVHHLKLLYDDINAWGIRILLGDEIKRGYVYDYFLAVEGESKFEEMINAYKSVLIGYREIETQSGTFYKTIQNFNCDQGIILILLKFIILLDSKSTVSQIGNSNNNNNNNNIIKDNIKGKSSPEAVAAKYTKSAIDLSFETIKLFINDNAHCSQALYMYINLINELFDYHKLQVIEMLIICLKNTNKKNSDFLLSHQSLNKANPINNNSNSSSNSNVYLEINFWKTKITELNEKQGNLLEQKLYIQVLAMLCLDSEGNGIFVNQMEVKIKMFEIDLFPLKFGMDGSNHSYVIFPTKLSNDIFFQNNPTLYELSQIKGNFRENILLFYYDSFSSKYSAYIDYISAVLDFYYAACVSRNQMNIHIISNSKIVGLTVAHIWQVIDDCNIPMAIRMRYLKLFRVLYIDTEPYLRISQYRFKIFKWNSEPKENEDLIDYIYKWFENNTNSYNNNYNNNNVDIDIRNRNDDNNNNNHFKWVDNKNKFDFLCVYIKNFFKKRLNAEQIINFVSFEDLSRNKNEFLNLLSYIKEIFILTKEMIDFGYFNSSDLNEFLVAFAYFFSVFEKYNSNIYKGKKTDIHNPNDNNNNDNRGDISISKSNLTKSSNQRNEYIRNILDNSTVGILKEEESIDSKNIHDKRLFRNKHWLAELAHKCMHSEFKEVKAELFILYETCIDILNTICVIKEDLQIYSFLVRFKKFYLECGSLTDSNDPLKIYNHISEMFNVLDFEIRDFDGDESSINSSKEQNLIPLDIYLLGILFNDYDDGNNRSLDHKALTLLIKYFGEFNHLKKQLSKLELIVNEKDLNIFNSLIIVNHRILAIKQLLLRDYVTYSITQNTEKQGNLNRLQDLKRNIEMELISKLEMKHNNKKLCKIQNICRHLKIHTTLIELMNFLMKYDPKLPIYNSIFKFLYYFCYKNYQNQVCLKQYFDPFLSIVSKYEYVSQVLTEIVTLFKETSKINIYIQKIFTKITSENDINPEIIDILRSLTQNYDERSLTLNQSTIFQNFLSHTNFKGGIFSDEELKELDQMILIVRKRVTNSLSTYKIILSKIKLIQLLSACSYENSFWVLHFRRLVKIENMVQFLISQEIPYKLKPASLAFFKNVFYPSSNTVESFPIDNIFKVIKLLVLPELHIFYFFASYFVDNKISKSGMDVNRLSDSEKGQILQLKDITLRKIKTDPVVKELLTIDIIDLKLLEVHSIFGCKKFLSEQKKLEYMRFLLCENTNYNIQQEGMLIFIGDVFKYIYELNVNLTIQQKGLINKVKEKLNDILDYLTIVEEKLGSDSKITDLEVVIQKSLIFASKRTYINNNICTNNNVNNNNNKESLLPLKTEDILHLKDNNDMKNNDNDTNCIDNEETRIITDKEQKNAIKILKLTYDSLCEKELSLTSIFNLQETDIDKEIDKFQFKRNLKLFLNNKASNNEIEDTLNYIDTNQDGLISLKDLSIKLKQISKEIPNKKKHKIADYQDINFFFDLESQIDDQSHKITNVFKHFILSFHEIQIKATKDQEFSEIVYKLNTFLIKNNQTDFIKRFLACLKGSFQKKKHKIFLIKIMSELITSKIIQVDNNQHHHHHDKYIHVSEIQNQLNNAGVTEFVLSLIEKNKTKNVIEESLNLLILLLKNGNRQVQKTIFNYLSSNPNNTFKFTSYVREVLHSEINKLKLKLNIKEYETTDIDLNKTNNIFSSSSSSPHETNNNDIINFNQDDYLYELTTNQIEGRIFIKDENQYYRIPYKILFLLKLCCENCYEPFQHFLREQDHLKKHTESLSSINIVYEIGNLIINLLNFGDIIYSDHETIQLINQGFITLTELCVGPCRENQILLGSRRMMFKMINNLLKRNYNFNIKEETQCKKNLLLCRAISFLKTLLNHETFIEYSSILLDELDIYLLVEKLMDIYHTKIYPNIDYLYAGKLCKHVDDFKYVFKRNLIKSSNIYKDKAARNCNNNLCNNNYITYIDQRYIKTGFDIFIILSYIKDAFPKHPKIFWFNYNSSNQISLNAFGKAELDEMNKQHKHKENKYKSKQHKRQKLHILQTKQTKKSMRSFQQQQQHKSNDVIGLNMKSDKGSDVDESEKSQVSYLSSYSKLNSDKDNNNNHNKSKTNHKKSKSKCCNCYFKKHKFIPKLLLYNYSKDNTKLKTNRTRIWKDNMKILETKFSDKDKNERDLTKRFINKYIDTFNECYLFYAKNISNVEILYRGEVVKTYFRIPYLFKYLENETKHEIIWESQSDNYQERLEELFKKISQVKMDLNYQQKLGVYRNIINKWPLLNAISFLISITINLILFFFVRNADEEYYDTEQNIYVFVKLHPTFDYYFKYNIIPSLLKILEFIQLALNIITIIFLFIHKYPVITFKLDKKADAVNLSLSERKIKKYSGSLLYNFLYEFIDNVNTTKQHFWIRIYKTFGIKMLLYPDFVILLIYLSVSICSLLVTPFFQIGLLFDILRRNKYLLIIFKAMKLNFFQIMSMLLLLLVILYIFATFEFFSLRQHFRSVDYMQTDPNEVDINSYCDNIYSCLFSVILIGLTSDNGLSIIGGEMSRNYKDYWKKYLLDVTFYLVVLVFVMNIILSLMIDSFRVLRDKIKANEKNIKEYCYVCGIPKYVFEIKGNGWMSHYKYEHNIFAYLYYIVELESKEKNECNGLEKYVKGCLEKEDYSFLPLNQSRILKDRKKKMATTNSSYGVNGNVNSNHNGSFSFNLEDYWKSIG